VARACLASARELRSMPVPAKVWALRVLSVAVIVGLCALAGSGIPSWALALAWGPNGLFLMAYTRGVLKFPRALEAVHPAEPVLYRWAGVGLVKRIVATRMWPMLLGFEIPPKPPNRRAFLDATERSMRGAEICHAATFVLALCIAAYCLAVGSISLAVWLLGFNLLLNGYPVMLQRSNRWRVQQVRAHSIGYDAIPAHFSASARSAKE
jgi:hypothetical protein